MNIYQRDINGNTPRTQCRQAHTGDGRHEVQALSCATRAGGSTGGGLPDASGRPAKTAQVMIGEVGEMH